jgi:PAS domain S-box-containing protein
VFSERLQRVIRSRKHETFETAVEARRIAVRIFPLSDGAAFLFGNVTEQHEQRLKVGVGQALCEATNRHAHAAGIRLEPTGRIKEVHDSFCSWLGVEREDIIGHHFIDLLPVSQRRDVSDLLEAANQGDSTRSLEVTLLNSMGQEVSGTLTVAPIQIDFITLGVMAVWVLNGVAVNANRAA